MPIAQALLPEWDHEMRNTRRVLERIHDEKASFRPHERSWSMIELATHLARLPLWAVGALTTDELDLDGTPRGDAFESAAEMLTAFERNAQAARDAIAASTDEQLRSPWSLKRSGQVLFTMPKTSVLRGFVMNHMIHHRGQLTVYLRLAGLKVPGIYGESADEAM